jgi:HAD superfamily hydrolase (TIGR01509 family)
LTSVRPAGAAGSPAPAAGGQGRRLQAVLLDMDGLLVDSEPLWFEVERVIMDRLGGPWAPADQEHLIGGSLERSVGYMLGKATRPAEPEEVGRWLVDGMAEVVRERGVPLKPGAADLLAGLAAADVPRALVTSAERAIMTAIIQVTGLDIATTVCAEDVTRRKPDPEPYLRAAALLGADPASCVALDDSPTGIASAEAAGCVAVAVPSVPIGDRPGRLTVASLTELDLPLLQGLVSG